MKILQDILSQSSLIFATRIVGAGLVFLVQAAIARFWGATLLGNYMLIMAVVNLLMLIMPLGFQTVGSYFASDYRAKKDAKMLKKFIFHSYSHIVLMAIIVAIIIVPLASQFDEIGQKITEAWLPIVILSSSIAIMYVNGSILIGLKRPFAAYFTDSLFRPMSLVAAFIIAALFFSEHEGYMNLLYIMSFLYMFIALLQFFTVVKTAHNIEDLVEEREKESKRWWRFAFPWTLIVLASDFFFDVDLIILSAFLDPHQLAIFGVSSRIFILIAFAISAVYAIIVPDMFEKEANNDRDGFLQKISEANLIASVLSLFLLLMVAIMGRFILAIFGEDFTIGLWPLVILCSGLLIRSIFGPASLVLSIYDRPYASLPSVFIGFFSLISLNYLLVPNYGIMGAAIAALLAITIWSASQWFVALKLAKINISLFSIAKYYSLKPKALDGK